MGSYPRRYRDRHRGGPRGHIPEGVGTVTEVGRWGRIPESAGTVTEVGPGVVDKFRRRDSGTSCHRERSVPFACDPRNVGSSYKERKNNINSI